MTHQFNVLKAVQAAAVLLRAEAKKMSRLRLLKLLFIAERKCLVEKGRTLLGGKFSVLRHGPIHSEVYDLIKGTHRSENLWSQYIVREGLRDLRLEGAEPDMGELSPYEAKLLSSTVEQHAELTDYDLAEITHGFPEVRDIRPQGDTSIPLQLESIVRAACPIEYREEIIADLKDKACI